MSQQQAEIPVDQLSEEDNEAEEIEVLRPGPLNRDEYEGNLAQVLEDAEAVYVPPEAIQGLAETFNQHLDAGQIPAVSRVLGTRARVRVEWTSEVEQMLVALALNALMKGENLRRLALYDRWVRDINELRFVLEGQRLFSRLQQLCHPSMNYLLRLYCGWMPTKSDEAKRKVEVMADHLRSAVLDLDLVRNLGLMRYVIIRKPIRTCRKHRKQNM